MLLPDTDIRAALDNGELIVTPEPTDATLQPASIDIHVDLSQGALVPVHGCKVTIDQAGVHGADYARLPPGDLVLAPGACALVCTRERVTIAPSLAVQVDGRSSVGRTFLAVHVTAGYCDPGFAGQITLELVNHSTFEITIRDGARIGQLKVFRLRNPSERPYGSEGRGSHYQGQMGATAPAQT